MILRLLIFAFLSLFLAYPAEAGSNADAISFVKAELAKGLPWDGEAIEIDGIDISGLGPAKYDSMRLVLPKRISQPGKVSYQLEVKRTGQEPRTVWGSARVRVFRNAVLALKPLKVRTKISEGDLKVARVELEEARDSFASASEVAGLVAIRPVTAGSVVKKTHVGPEVVVKRGEKVLLKLDGENITVRSTGIASQDGHKGSKISVKTANGREVLGTVAGPGRVVIKF
ncbi:MAG: flagellar basal body P-ring formation protein FlgA [Deltaproteobacteria bacterium]|nr:flagellar basal body P-ring formation protein FlgA [Deltaproteobacteria bacterium]MBZ0219260.1 flagellar basal body P-ring formation chaperone FlgA [Deltaproteobacteria bacterium]